MPNISPATVNRTTTLVLKTIIGRAKRTWRYSFPLEPIWRDHLLEEPEERVREMHDHEANALDATFRDDYWPWYEFARLTGLRRKETLLRWSNVTWNAGRQAEGIWGQISILGKNDRRVTTPITTAVKELLGSLIGHNAEWVFTYVAQKTKDGRVRGARYPITKEGAKTTWRRTRAKAGIMDFRFHDIRHDLATKVLRTTGNLKLTQKMLNHADIKTTARYAHVLDEEVAVALQEASESRNKSRKSTAIRAQAA
jgi:integrase